MTIIELESIAEEYINENISIKNLAKRHNLSKTTLVRYFKGEQEVYLSTDLQIKVDNKKNKNWIDGKSTSGNKGKISIDKNKLQALAKLAISKGYTLRQLSEEIGTNPSTLYNLLIEANIGTELYNGIKELYAENNHKKGK